MSVRMRLRSKGLKGIPHPAHLREKARELVGQGATVREAARRLDVSKSALHEWVAGSRRAIYQPISPEVTPVPLRSLPVTTGPKVRISDNDRFNAELDEAEARLKDNCPIAYLAYQSGLADLSETTEKPGVVANAQLLIFTIPATTTSLSSWAWS
jgi:transposase-like protein